MNILEKIKLLYNLNKIFKGVKELMKKGNWFSTEFVLNLLTILGTLASAVVGLLPAVLVLKIVAGLVVVYTVGRSIAKLTPTKKDDEIIEKIGDIVKNLGGKVPAEDTNK